MQTFFALVRWPVWFKSGQVSSRTFTGLPLSLLHHLGCVPGVTVLLEGDPSAQFKLISNLGDHWVLLPWTFLPECSACLDSQLREDPSCAKPLFTLILTLLVTCSLNWGRTRVRTRIRARPGVRTRRIDPPGSEAHLSYFLEEEDGSCMISSIFRDKCQAWWLLSWRGSSVNPNHEKNHSCVFITVFRLAVLVQVQEVLLIRSVFICFGDICFGLLYWIIFTCKHSYLDTLKIDFYIVEVNLFLYLPLR